MAAIEARDFGVYQDGQPLLEKVSLGVEAGTITALVGPAGSGKSLFLRCINRLADIEGAIVTKGTLQVFGQDVYAPSTDVIALRRTVGMVFTQPTLPVASVFDNAALAPRMAGITDRHELAERVEEVLRKVGLWEAVQRRLHGPAEELTAEQQQRLCVARVLAAEPGALLFDEPTAHLDYPSAGRVEDLIVELGKTYPVLITAQSPQQASHIAEFTAFFYQGKMVEAGPTVDVLTNPRDPVTEAYVTGRLS